MFKNSGFGLFCTGAAMYFSLPVLPGESHVTISLKGSLSLYASDPNTVLSL
jgi:hypothetical protein